MTAGRFFANEGFLATSFTPVIDVMPLDELSYRYTHYPPLAEILNGAVQWVTGSDSLAMFRLIFVGFSALSVLFFFRYVRRVWGERVAWIASALFATNSLWLKYADCIHSHPLHLMTGSARCGGSRGGSIRAGSGTRASSSGGASRRSCRRTTTTCSSRS